MLLHSMSIWNIVQPFGIFNGHLITLESFGIFFPPLWYMYCAKKNLATLVVSLYKLTNAYLSFIV
jgi:hypothetical protein